MADEENTGMSDQDVLMQSFVVPEDFQSNVSIDEPAADVSTSITESDDLVETDIKKPKRLATGPRGSRFTEGFERPLPPAGKPEQSSVYLEIVEQIFESERNDGKSIDDAYEVARKKANRAFLYGDLSTDPLEDYEPPTSVVGAAGRIFSRRRLFDVQSRDPNTPQFERELEENRRQEKAYRTLIQKEGEMSALKKYFSDSPKMTEQEAKESGIQPMFKRTGSILPQFSDEEFEGQEFFGRDLADGVDADVSFFEDPYIPYGIKNIPNLIERAGIKAAIPNMFSNLFIDDDEKEAFETETRTVLPTKNFEQIVETVRSKRATGITDDEIKRDFRDQLAQALTMQSYRDLPSGFQMKEPSVDLFATEVTLNPSEYVNSSHGPLSEAASLVVNGASRNDIQKQLNKVALGALPSSVVAGSIPSSVDLIDETLKSVDRVIEAQSEPGEAADVLKRAFTNTTYSVEKVGDEVMVVENTLGKFFRLLALAQEGVAEVDATFGFRNEDMKNLLRSAGLPDEIVKLAETGKKYGFGPFATIASSPLFPASRDFYYNYGMRDADSTYLSRVLANLATGNAGYMVHGTNEARKDGFETGDPEFHAKMFLGGLLDFLIPWERLYYGPAAHTTKAAARGSSLVKKLGADGYKARAFLAGASPALYDRIYNVSERASLALDGVKNRVGDKPNVESLQALLRQDDAAQQAIAQNQPVPKTETGSTFDPLTLNERNFTEELSQRMDNGESFDAAFDSIKRNYKPDVFETAGDVAAALTQHVLETNEGAFLFARGNPGSPNYKPGIIPWQMEQQLERAFGAAGIKYADVKAALKNDIGGKAPGYLAAIRTMLVTGADPDTLELRNSKPYISFRKKLENEVKKGQLTEAQKVALLAIMETRAHNSAALKVYKTISEPEDFFNQAKIKTVTPKLKDGSLGTARIQIKVGKNVADIDMASVDKFIDILKAEDVLSMQKLFDGTGELLVDIMGKPWTTRFLKRFQSEPNTNKAKKMPEKMLTKDGKMRAEQKLRSVIEANGRLSADTLLMRELYANLSSIYSRLGDDFKQTVLTPAKTSKLHNFLRPDEFFKNAAVILNRGRPRRPGTVVRVSNKQAERVKTETARAAGTKRVFADIDTNTDHVRQSLGITKDTTNIDPVQAMTRGLAFVVAETMKKEEASSAIRGMPLVRLTAATFATKDKAPVIRSRVNARMGSVLGISDRTNITGRGYLKAERLAEMADSKTSTLSLSKAQQASFKTFLQRLSSEPFVASRIPDNIVGANADLSKISFKDYNRVVELLTDVEASSFARRTVYTEAISRSLAYSLLGAIRGEGANIIEAITPLDNTIRKLREWFVLDDPLINIRPELREVLERELAKLGETRSEVIKMIKKAREQSPDATIEDIFDSLRLQLEEDMQIPVDKIDLLVGEWDLVNDRAGRKGIIHVLQDLTEAEITRINRDFDISQKKRPRQFADEQEEIIAGEDIIQEGGVALYSDIIPEGVSRLQFITQDTTVSMLQDVLDSGGMNGISERLSSALTILRTYTSENGLSKAEIAKLTDIQRVEISSAIMTIRDTVEQKAEYLKRRGGIILSGLAGKKFDLSKISAFSNPETSLQASAAAYKAFHRGGEGFRELYDIMVFYQAEIGADPKKIAKYSPAQAYLDMTVRLMAEDKIIGMYDEMIKVGMPGAFENYRIPKGKISPTGAKYSIETPHKFHQRVRAYMGLIANRSLDIEELFVEDGSVVGGRRKTPSGPYEPAAFERLGRPFNSDPKKFEDLDAALAAEEILVRFGARTQAAGESLTEIAFPDGSIVYGPEAIKNAIDDALLRASNVGEAFGTETAKRLSQAEFGVPFYPEFPEKGLIPKTYSNVANAIETLFKVFPVTFTNIKRGITTGLVIPTAPYYTANFMGGALQLVTAVDPLKAASMLTKNPKMVGAVMARMFGDGEQFPNTVGGAVGAISGGVVGGLTLGPLGAVGGIVAGGFGGKYTGKKIGRGYQPFGNHVIVTKNGMIYNADQVAEMANLYRLNSSFISAETQRSMAEDVKNYLRDKPSRVQRGAQFFTDWQDYLSDVATSIDNFYRVSIFVDQLNDGVAPSQAAGLARRAAFDYGALTDVEKKFMRQVIMFYSYLKKSSELTFDTLLTNPERVLNQLRLTGGIHQSTLEEDPQVVLPEYMQARPLVGVKEAIANTHAYDNRMYVLPPIPAMDAINITIDVLDSARGDTDALRKLGTKLTPWVQWPFVAALEKDFFYGEDIDKYNKINPWLMEWDLAVTGGFLRDWLNVSRDTHRNPRLRLVEGDEDRQYYRGRNGIGVWTLKNMVQIPGFGRSATLITAMDRANLGVVEALTEIMRSMRLDAEELGLVGEREFEFEEGDTMSPRVGLTPRDELLTLLAVRAQLVPNVERVRALILKDIDMTRKKRFAGSTDPIEQAFEKVIRER